MSRLRLLNPLLPILLLAHAAPARADYPPGAHVDETLVHDGTPRFYDVYAPVGYTGATPVPLVVDVHGLSSSKTAQRTALSGFAALADVEGFLVAYPQGLHGDPADDELPYPPGADLTTVEGPSWNAGDFCCAKAFADSTDDVGFIRAMVAAIRAEGNVDGRRIYVTGLSNGGFLTQTLACEAADLFAAAAPVAAPGAFSPLTNCTPSRPIPVLTFQGVTDPIVPYAGGHLLGDPSLPVISSALASFEFWRDVNGCAGLGPDVSEDIGLGNTCDRYEQCADGVAVELCGVTGSAIPPPNEVVSGHVLYFNDNGLDVALRAWTFLSQYALPASNAVPVLPAPALAALAAALAGVGLAMGRRAGRRR